MPPTPVPTTSPTFSPAVGPPPTTARSRATSFNTSTITRFRLLSWGHRMSPPFPAPSPSPSSGSGEAGGSGEVDGQVGHQNDSAEMDWKIWGPVFVIVAIALVTVAVVYNRRRGRRYLIGPDQDNGRTTNTNPAFFEGPVAPDDLDETGMRHFDGHQGNRFDEN